MPLHPGFAAVRNWGKVAWRPQRNGTRKACAGKRSALAISGTFHRAWETMLYAPDGTKRYSRPEGNRCRNLAAQQLTGADLVLASDEEIFQMQNGCICCFVDVMKKLLSHQDQFDHIIVET